MPEKFTPLVFPRDESVHNHIIEWWYFNGQMTDAEGRDYAFMNCLFRADVKKVKIPFLSKIPVKIVYFYHSVISDIENNKSYPSVDDLCIVSEDSFSKPLLFINHSTPLAIPTYTNRELEEISPFVYRLKDENVDLLLTSTKKPLLEGGEGYVNLLSKKSYYYSLTNLTAEGKIKVDDQWIAVTGKAWMDHQWANAGYSKDKWSWFSIQLDNEREIVCYEYDGGEKKTYLASLLNAAGHAEHFEEVEMTPLGDTWTSPKTKATYPLTWQIKIPAKNIDLKLTPKIIEQEMIFGSINYWEGPLTVTGTWEKEEVTGHGFMELVGYPSEYGNFQYAQDKIVQSAKEIFKFAKEYLKKD
ncbi:MAG: lipocalin family protein [Candidatus Paceibacterota bacterium]|jgi:predicted secreted hydrolase